MIGGLLGLSVGWLLTNWVDGQALSDWGWRIPFLTGILVGEFGLWIRAGVPESPAYLMVKNSGSVRRPIVVAFRQYKRQMLVTAGLNWVVSARYYVVFVWLITDLTKVAGLSLHRAMGIGVLGLAFGIGD